MEKRRKKNFDLLAAGELLIDFISTDFADSLDDVHHFKRLMGGSPANMCMNMSRLGNRTVLAASVGEDDMGHWVYRQVEEAGVDTQLIRKVSLPTTLILVTRSKAVSNFEAYRSADCQITAEQFPEDRLRQVSLFHTSCFGLSRPPARDAILQAAKSVVQNGGQLSIDANYAAKIWPDRKEAQDIVKRYCGMGALVKVSEVDWHRLYGSPLTDAARAARHFLDLGARQACITMGGDGVYVEAENEAGVFLPARPVDVKDTTGAGDAFWSGYLTAWLDDYDIRRCALAGRRMAELKLGHFGPLPRQVERQLIYADFV